MQNLPESQSVNDLDQIITREQENKQTGVAGYIIWGLTIPPISTIWSIYAANKKGVLHLLVPTMTIVYTIFFALLSYTVFAAPKAFTDVASARLQTGTQIPSIPTWLIFVSIILTIAGLAGGWYLRSKARRDGYLSKIMMGALLAILALQFFVEFRELKFISSAISQSVGDIYQGL